jgi:hypothetical protein
MPHNDVGLRVNPMLHGQTVLYKKTLVETMVFGRGGGGRPRVKKLMEPPPFRKSKMTIPERTKWKRN